MEIENLKTLIPLALYILQILLPILGLGIVYCIFESLFGSLNRQRTLITLFDQTNKNYIPVVYWENSIGRDKHSDIVVNSPLASRNHAVLFRRDKGWFVSDTNSKEGTFVNGRRVNDKKKVPVGGVISVGGMDFTLCQSNEREVNRRLFAKSRNYSSSGLMSLVTIFNLLIFFQLSFSYESPKLEPLVIFALITSLSWVYYFIAKYIFHRVNLEIEILGIFLSSIGINIATSVNIDIAFTQFIALTLGIILFNCLVWLMKNPDFAIKCRPYIAAFAVMLLVVNLVFGKVKNGSQNWISFGNISIQPSEFVKIVFVFFGASTLRELQTTKNLTEFIFFSCICMVSLFLMGDFGTACVFFVAFLLIAFMRSGSVRTVLITIISAIIGLTFILNFKPYIVKRFSAWRHVWEHVNDIGYQQTRVLTYSASGGLLGVGIGKGYLRNIFASSSDLVFGFMCEEFGMILSLIIVISIALIGIYAKTICPRSRCAFYSITSCGAAGIIVFQMMMNIFGSVDIFPLTGITLPFISVGGSSLVSVWGLLAFIKSADERTYGLKRK